ncbi:MAG: ABC transporter substrate-binding protein [Spirochaetales bacterium]|nr:ABC transporter substrate-binding protein [Spirochaetales bacterium]
MKKKLIISTLIILLILAGCAKNESAETSASESPGTGSIDSGGSVPAKVTLNIGLMPAVDTAPIFLAKERGYFNELGLELGITLFTSAQDRQSALQSGEIDGAMTDLVAVAVNVSGGFDMKATMLTDGMFPLLALPGAADKGALKVGMMEISVSNFLVDQWLSADYEVEKVYINSIPARLEALASGQLDMGLFPEPIASVGTLKGLEKLIFKPVDGFSPDVMVFTGKALKDKSSAISMFHEGYNRAIVDINRNEEQARDILISSIPNLKPELKNMMNLPEYYEARLPDADYLNKIISWTNGILPQKLDVTAERMVDRSFVKP